MKKAITLLNNHKLVITNDDYAESPDTYGNEEMFLIYCHRQFDVRRKGFEPIDIYDYQKEVNKAPEKQDMNSVKDFSDYYIYQVNAYIHSGISLSLGAIGDNWDTSTTGYVLITKELGQTTEIAKKLADGLIESWNKYLSNEIYRFELYKLFPYKKQYIIDSPTEKEEEIGYDEELIEDCGGYECDKLSDILQDIEANLWNQDIKKLVDD